MELFHKKAMLSPFFCSTIDENDNGYEKLQSEFFIAVLFENYRKTRRKLKTRVLVDCGDQVDTMNVLDPFSAVLETPKVAWHNRTHHHAGRAGEKDELEYVGKVGDDDDPMVWVYKINVMKRWVEVVAAVFMVLTCAMMGNQIGLHLTHNLHPGFRTYTVRILLMVPIYSITSYGGLHSPSHAIIWAM
jgi:hypothetical protein